MAGPTPTDPCEAAQRGAGQDTKHSCWFRSLHAGKRLLGDGLERCGERKQVLIVHHAELSSDAVVQALESLIIPNYVTRSPANLLGRHPAAS